MLLGAFRAGLPSGAEPGFPLQVLGFANANPVGFPLQSLARAPAPNTDRQTALPGVVSRLRRTKSKAPALYNSAMAPGALLEFLPQSQRSFCSLGFFFDFFVVNLF
jgi:hypothetical protein